tara:strand:+ start:140 stop:673 length:534 start_codon:yes stop_codon:yes gene_type:complete
MHRYLSLLLLFWLPLGQTPYPMTGEKIKPQYDPNTGELIKPKVILNNEEISSIKERAISDAKSMNMSHWVLYTPIAGATFFSSLFTTARAMDTMGFYNKRNLWITSGTLGLALPYFILQQSEKVIYPNDIISESKKKIYKSSFYDILFERRILYSIIGVPITAGIGFLTLMSLFSLF